MRNRLFALIILSAAELGYPENVRLLISSEGTTLAIQACDKDDPCAVPFYVRKNRRGSEGAEKVDNRKQPNADAHHSHKTRLG